ncbi:beta and beta-prime subunits of DNA dependent RNA-polymerase [Marasmius fiardii PR-910]|nr:beta and beta-prime subunits of DNA dependent RNA-polymerase [Marasmius fiardii PR-910]
MNISHSLPSSITGISFSFLTTEDVRRISVKQIVNPNLLDGLNRPNIGGLYDPALGPSERSDICATCRLGFFTCPGHFGHIELPAPVFHPLFLANLYNLLRGTCLFCHRFKIDRETLCKYVAKFRLLEYGLLEAAQGLDDLNRVETVVKKAKGKKRKVGAEDEDDSDEEDSTGQSEHGEKENDTDGDETPYEFMARVNRYVTVHLSRASSSKRDSYKDTLVYQARKELINEFLKATILTRCKNESCQSFAYTFRKEGHTKIIEYDLSAKQKLRNTRIRPDVFKSHSAKPESKAQQDSDVEMSGSESDDEGESVGLEGDEDDEEEDKSSERKEDSLPRAANGKVKTKRGRNERVIAPEECRAHLRRLFENESTMCSLLYGKHGPFAKVSSEGLSLASADMFFLDVLPVTPTRFRPPSKMNDVMYEHPQNELLAKVLQTSYRLRDINIRLKEVSAKGEAYDEAERKKSMASLLEALIQLQVNVNSFMDSNKNPTPMRQGKLPPTGVKQTLEKKEGLFRKHMMGKRVNYAARSVISPDVNIEPNEIGIPPVFARKLTFPEPVTPYNFHKLRQQVINGSLVHPGASMVEFEDGHQVSLDKLTVEQRTAIGNQLLTPQEGERTRKGLRTRTNAINKKVYRHLEDGDILILNRQPTLHKPSMMTHKARILHGEKTIRMHYANCNSYNADFDGDEMNIHFPQNQVARAEAEILSNTDNQYLVPTSGNPLRGLIQDHVVAGVWMTSQGTFFTREEYFQLLYGALRPEDDCTPRLETLPPTIWKPVPLWTGKQVISTILKNITPENMEGINLNAGTKVPGHLWGSDSMEDKVVFMDGELLCGVLDKAAFGASDYGVVHSVYELYGASVAGRLLGILSRLFTKFLQHRAFTCRMDDLSLTAEGDATRKDIIEKAKNLGTDGAIENFPSLSKLPKNDVPDALRSLLQDVLRDDNKMAGLDVTVKTKLSKLTSDISDACLPHKLLRRFPHNNMQTMTLSGAKGSAVNARQISCALGQQELEGRRVPVMVSGKTLPSFKAFETKAIAGGYVASRFLTGVKPQEFYFHCMAGREGLIDTAVKTSRSGYLQRCLIKHLEGVRVHYDNTVRGSDSSIYQFHYGGDALDVTKQKHLHQFDFIAQNEQSWINLLKPDRLDSLTGSNAAKYMKKVLKKSLTKRNKYEPALSLFNPSRDIGATSEHFAEELEKYVKDNKRKLIEDDTKEVWKSRKERIEARHFRLLMHLKYMKSLVEPGEAVGLLASQGVGEPSTQMTLNTFHFAGHGAANVTLGIPRLREIVMTASQKPKTPSMTIRVRPGTPQEDIDRFCKRASKLTLSQVVERIAVTEKLWTHGDSRRRLYTIEIFFFPREEYEAEYDTDPAEVVSSFGVKFPLTLKKEMTAEMKRVDADMRSQISQLGQGKKSQSKDNEAAEGDDDGEEPKSLRNDDDGSEDNDGDAGNAKHAREQKEQASYESDDDDSEDDDEELVPYNDEELEVEYAGEMEAQKHNESKFKSKSKNFKARVKRVRDMFQRNFHPTDSFEFEESKATIVLSFPADLPKLLLVSIVERTCHATVIREIPGITDCFQSKEEKKDQEPIVKLTTNGSNFRGLWEFASSADETILDDDETYSNDIYAILNTYGVEMARAAIFKEMSGIFGLYKIQVDRRHLELIADYMTFDGGYKPFNRKGISTNPSPLLKASYETTAAFLSDATLHGDFDDLSTPSGNIVLGRPISTGTGAFDVLMPIGS